MLAPPHSRTEMFKKLKYSTINVLNIWSLTNSIKKIKYTKKTNRYNLQIENDILNEN